MVKSVYRLNNPSVVSETFDNEVVIINLESGHYFSLNDSGKLVYELLLDGHPASKLLNLLSRKFKVDESELQEFLVQLVQHNILVAGTPASDKVELNEEYDLENWERPELSVYTDLEELLLLDPIHEVDDAGWPAAKSD